MSGEDEEIDGDTHDRVILDAATNEVSIEAAYNELMRRRAESNRWVGNQDDSAQGTTKHVAALATVDIGGSAAIAGAFIFFLHLFLADNPYWTTLNMVILWAVCCSTVLLWGGVRKAHSLWRSHRFESKLESVRAEMQAEHETRWGYDRDQ